MKKRTTKTAVEKSHSAWSNAKLTLIGLTAAIGFSAFFASFGFRAYFSDFTFAVILIVSAVLVTGTGLLFARFMR